MIFKKITIAYKLNYYIGLHKSTRSYVDYNIMGLFFFYYKLIHKQYFERQHK